MKMQKLAMHARRVLINCAQLVHEQKPVRLSLSIGLALSVIGIASVYAAARAPAARPAAPQYNVLVSRDEKLCITLRDFYNRHLRDRDSETTGYIEDQFGREMQGTDIQFLRESENWRPPRDLLWAQAFLALDIYNDGTSHAVIVVDRGINVSFGTFFSEILVLKPGSKPDDVPHDSLYEVGRRFDHIDPNIEQYIEFSGGGSSLTPPGNGYAIAEIAPSAERGFPTSKPLPPLMSYSHQRLIRNRDRIYGAARQAFNSAFDNIIRPGAQIGRNGILVYSIEASGKITDICFLEFVFTQPPPAN